jgi:hypothetical protein
MPGTGSLRRSSTPDRNEAIVGKSLVRAEILGSPGLIFSAAIVFCHVIVGPVKSASAGGDGGLGLVVRSCRWDPLLGQRLAEICKIE